MPDFSAQLRPLRVQVCLDLALDREAYLAKIGLEPGFAAVQGSLKANLPDVRLASRCRMDLSTPEIETVVLVATPACARPCECCPTIARTVTWSALMQALRKAAGHDELARTGGGVLSALTRRELEVLRLVGLGKTVNQCADALGVSPSTIGNHKYRLMRKLGVINSLQLLRIAVRHGLADLHGPTDHSPAEPADAEEEASDPRSLDLDHLGGGVADR
jgi:DNA-binding CsgD family transcriptional regulator